MCRCIVVAPPLSVDTVTHALESLTHRWRDVGGRDLRIPTTILDGIQSDHSSDAERLRSCIRYWLLRDPIASWRRLIHELDDWDKEDYNTVANGIRKYAKKLQGQQQYCS